MVEVVVLVVQVVVPVPTVVLVVKSVVGNGESTKFGLIGGSKEKQS